MVLNFGEKVVDGPPREVMENEAVKRAYLGSEERGNFKGTFFAGCSKMPRCKAPEILRVASRRIRSDSCHAETVRRPRRTSGYAAMTKDEGNEADGRFSVACKRAKMLEVRNLMVFFENALAINDLSLEVRKGEIVGVLGSNSAGKTTLMNTISGLMIDIKKKEDRRGGERITILGEIYFEGEDITNAKPDVRVKKGIVLSRERHPIFPESSCRGES